MKSVVGLLSLLVALLAVSTAHGRSSVDDVNAMVGVRRGQAAEELLTAEAAANGDEAALAELEARADASLEAETMAEQRERMHMAGEAEAEGESEGQAETELDANAELAALLGAPEASANGEAPKQESAGAPPGDGVDPVPSGKAEKFPPVQNTPPNEEESQAFECWIKQRHCPEHKQYAGRFKDPFTPSYTAKQCFARARWFHDYCGLNDYTPTTAIWGKTGKKFVYQVWHQGDRVSLPITHKIRALCGKATGSTTVFYGSICANGNIQWEWMRTLDPPAGFEEKQCTWRKVSSSDYNWISSWFGDCDNKPTMVPQIKSNKPKQITGLKREWFRSRDKVQMEVTTNVRGLCAKATGSRVQYLGEVCADGVNVEWQRIKVLEPREGLKESECRWRRDTAPKHVVSLFMGSCKNPPRDVPQIKTTVATELLPAVRRGWYRAGNEVYTTIKTKIGSLCASASGSSTVYKGTICANGNVRWDSMQTLDPRAPYTIQQCSWSRKQTTNRKWLDTWLGSCNSPPVGVPQLASSDPGDLPNVLRNRNPCANTKKPPCHAEATCERIFPSKHVCTCKEGWSGDGIRCSEVDPCEKSPCDKQATCKKVGPGQHECTCHKGFAGDGKDCKEVDPCEKNPCDRNAKCKKTGPGAHVCRCLKGYRMQNGVCVEIDACLKNPCHGNAKCSKTGPGTYSCKCNKGFVGDGKFCREKNDCDVTPAPCSAYANCAITGPGKHKCTCKPGYKGDGIACDEINACAAKPCDKHGVCKRTGPGKFKCTCMPGYKKKKGFRNVCEEVNNCDKEPCDKNAHCKKTGPGTHTCSCKSGFKGDGITCDAIDACASHPCPLHSLCRKTGPGKFACQCKTGYKRAGQVCVERNACDSNPCDAHAKCHKTGPGTHLCVCAKNYKMVGSRCEEVDACEKNPCNPQADCVKTGPNRFRCKCKKGFSGDGTTCREIDSCALKPFPCSKDATCTKTGPGKFKCECIPGYVGNGLKCEEKNNCVPSNPCDKNAFCTMTGPGKHTCTCNKGFVKFGESCNEIDACLSHPCSRDAECERTGPGTSSCKCKPGYEGNGFVCGEINACLSNPCDKHAVCQRDGGGKFKCLCSRGYKMSLSGTCEEIDACQNVPYPCDPHAACTKTGPSAFICTCRPGFQMNQKQQCEELDPCNSNPCPRTAVCSTYRSKLQSPDGEYRLAHQCTCLPGYKKTLEGKCLPVDPCASNPCDMHAICKRDGLAKYECTCKPGYSMNPKTQVCEEIQACLSKPCPLNSHCVNTGPALHVCICAAGYKMNKGVCEEADACLSGPCGQNAVCQRSGPGTFSCHCVPGFAMDGAVCVQDDNLIVRQRRKAAEEARAKNRMEDELAAQQKKLEQEKLAEIAALRQKEELRRFGERLDTFLRQRRVKREFAQDGAISQIHSRIEDLEHAANVLVKNSEQQAQLARELLIKKQNEHHVVEKKQLLQHQHDLDLLELMKAKVQEQLKKARVEAEHLYKSGQHGYHPRRPPTKADQAKAKKANPPPKPAKYQDKDKKPAAAAAPAPAAAPAAAPKAAPAAAPAPPAAPRFAEEQEDSFDIASLLSSTESAHAESQVGEDLSLPPPLPDLASLEASEGLPPASSDEAALNDLPLEADLLA